MKTLGILTTALVLAGAGAAHATDYGHYRGNDIDRRQSYQESRIQQGLRSGELTRHEYRQLEAEQARIREMERRAKADGRVDRYEAARIRNAQNEASRHIYQEKHDGQRRWYRWW